MGSDKIHHVIIADSQFLVVEALKSLLEKDGRFHVAGIAATKKDLLHLLEMATKKLLITDFINLDDNGIDLLKTIRVLHPEILVLVLTNTLSKGEFNALTKLGIKNIIYKSADKDELFSAIEATLKGKKFYADEILDQILETGDNKLTAESEKNLTTSEIEIVKLIAEGLTTKEIALKRNISHHTVNTHRKNIFRKTEVSNASELIMHAIKAGWINNIEYYI